MEASSLLLDVLCDPAFVHGAAVEQAALLVFHERQGPDAVPFDLEQVVVGVERRAGLRQQRWDERRERRCWSRPRDLGNILGTKLPS